MTSRKDYGSQYYVTNEGKIYIKKRLLRGKNQHGVFEFSKPEKELKGGINTTGYRQVRIDGKNECVHVIVAKCFIPNPENLPVVNHLDGEKLNCHPSNLEWTTYSGNQRHAYATGLKRKLTGEDSPYNKHSEEIVKAIYLAAKNKIASQEKIGIMFGVPQITVSNIKTKKTWSHVTDLLD